jgi:hypothetical protein
MLSTFLILAVSIAFAAARLMISVPEEKNRLFDSYKAFAHLWVGGLFGGYFVGGSVFLLTTAVVISLVELAAFLKSRFRKINMAT